jgi:serine protease Do
MGVPGAGARLGSVKPSRLVGLVATTTLSLSGCTGLFTARAPDRPRPPPRPAPSLSPLPPFDPNGDRIVQVVRRVGPAVVNVQAEVGGGRDPEGTGFLIRQDGIVVTNWHVVEGGLGIRVITAEGDRLEGRVIGGDQAADLAVVKVVPGEDPLPTVPLGRSDRLRLGESVVALGFALGLEGGPSVTSGIVSALGRTITAQDPNLPAGERTYEDIVQTDAAINPGNSGGPLVDLSGRVVGINTAGAGAAENIGFAIAIDRARPIIEHAMENPDAPAPFLGVSTQTVTPEVAVATGLATDRGVLVQALAPSGPAQKAGFEVGDVIVAVDGNDVADNEDLQALLLEHEPGEEAVITVVRDSSTDDVPVRLGVRPLPVEG